MLLAVISISTERNLVSAQAEFTGGTTKLESKSGSSSVATSSGEVSTKNIRSDKNGSLSID